MAKGQLSPDNTTMSFAIPKKLKEEIGMIAAKENRSMSNLIVTLLDNYAYLYKERDKFIKYQELISQINVDE